MARTVLYARVSTRDQKLDLQLDAARKLGVQTADIFVEKASGVRAMKWRPDMVARARDLMDKDGLNADDAAKVLGVSRRTLFRGLRAAREHDELAGAAALVFRL